MTIIVLRKCILIIWINKILQLKSYEKEIVYEKKS
jgi:hypothetical protein